MDNKTLRIMSRSNAGSWFDKVCDPQEQPKKNIKARPIENFDIILKNECDKIGTIYPFSK